MSVQPEMRPIVFKDEQGLSIMRGDPNRIENFVDTYKANSFDKKLSK